MYQIFDCWCERFRLRSNIRFRPNSESHRRWTLSIWKAYNRHSSTSATPILSVCSQEYIYEDVKAFDSFSGTHDILQSKGTRFYSRPLSHQLNPLAQLLLDRITTCFSRKFSSFCVQFMVVSQPPARVMTPWSGRLSDSSHISFSDQHESCLGGKFESTFHDPQICSKTHWNPLKLGAHPHVNYTHLNALLGINGAESWKLMLTTVTYY